MSATPTTPAAPDALLYIADGCPHCPAVLQGLAELIKAGRSGRLEVINVGQRPELARAHGVRAVPWLRIGPFELTGLRTPGELEKWAARAGSVEGMADYLRELLMEGSLAGARGTLQRSPEQSAAALIHLLGDAEAELQVRVGVAALIEELEGTPALAGLVPTLGELTRHADARVRIDAAHALGLSHAPVARTFLDALRDDPDADVREVAQESAQTL